MADEKFIAGKHDDAHHDGRVANVKREQESQLELDEAHLWFQETFGVPLDWAIEMAQVDGEVGDHWRGVFKYINDMNTGSEGKDG